MASLRNLAQRIFDKTSLDEKAVNFVKQAPQRIASAPRTLSNMRIPLTQFTPQTQVFNNFSPKINVGQITRAAGDLSVPLTGGKGLQMLSRGDLQGYKQGIKEGFTPEQKQFNQIFKKQNKSPQDMKIVNDYMNNYTTQLAMGAVGPGVGSNFTKRQLQTIRNGFTPEVRDLVGQFAAIVEKNPNAGRKNLGQVGEYVQGLAESVFGKKVATLNNKQLLNLLDTAQEQAFKLRANPKFSIGLSTGDLRSGKVSKNEVGRNIGSSEQLAKVINNKKIPTEPPLSIDPPKKINLFNQMFNRVRNNIASQGEAGKALAGGLQKSRDLAETTAGNWVSRLKTVRSLSKQEFNDFVDAAEGNKPATGKIAQAVAEWNQIRDEIYNTAKQSGLEIGKLENYFPHVYDDKIFSNKNLYNKAINHLVESGQAKDQAEAIRLISYARDVSRNRRQGNLEFERLVNLPNYERTKEALFNYISSASNRIAQVNTFGKSDEKALELIKQIAASGGDAQEVKNLFDIGAGARRYNETASKVSRTIRGVNATTKLGLGAITNVGQNVNTATVTGVFNTLKNIPGVFNPKNKEFALEAGITLDSTLSALREGAGFSGLLGKVGAPGFNTVEKFNRTLAAVAGRDYARKLAAKGDWKTLEKMGIRLAGNKLTPEQEIQAARNIVERTQFKVDPQDLPGWTDSPIGKLISQFRTFSYNQSAFIGREILEPAIRGDVRPLVRFLAIGLPVGLGLQTTKNILRNRKDEENPIKRTQQAYSQVGGFGLAGDIITGLFPMNGKYLDPNRATTLAIGTLGGPTLGTLAEGYGSLTNAVQGKPENLGRFALRQIPVAGGTLQNTILPYESQSGELNRRFNFFGEQANASGIKDEKIEYKVNGKKKTFDLTPPTKGSGIGSFANSDWKESKAVQLWNNENIDQKTKNEVFKKWGLDSEDVRYAALASYNTDVSTQYIISKSKSHDELLNNLLTGRVVGITGKQFADNSVISKLNEQGLLSDEEAKQLKALKVDKNGKNLAKAKKAKTIKISIRSAGVPESVKLAKSKPVKQPTFKARKKPVLKNVVKTKPAKFKAKGFKNSLTASSNVLH